MLNCMNSKPQHYYSDLRDDLAYYIDEADNTILDIGCGSGITGSYLRMMHKAVRLVGIEINPEVAKIAENTFDKIFVAI